ncbi:MAG TPA: GAF domain-containing protein [Anaerolineales bacterium]|nr:GAF domain-containing protein [Anaerolineales bacterium]
MKFPHWLTSPQFEQEQKTHKARNLFNTLVTVFAVEIVCTAIIPVIFPENLLVWIFIGSAIILTIGCYFLLQARRLRLASILFCVLLGAIPFIIALNNNGVDSFAIQIYTIVVLIAGLLLGARSSLLIAILGSLGLVGLYFIESTGIIFIPPTSLPIFLKISTPSFVFILSAILLMNAIRNMETILQKARENITTLYEANLELQNVRTTLEQEVENRTIQLNATNAIGQTINRILDLDQLGIQVVKKLTTLFDFDFAAIYMVDSNNQWATLRYTHPEIPSPQGDSHRFNIGMTIELETALRSLKPYIEYLEIPQKAENAKLLKIPEARFAITLPLYAGGKAIGAINVQSTQKIAFSQQGVETLQNVANQIAIAFENARLFQESQTQLSEINRLNQLYLQTTWRAYLAKETSAFQFSAGELQETAQPDFAALEIAQQNRKIHVTQENGDSFLVAPILFQDQVLGAIKLKATGRAWTTDEFALIEATLNQTALSLENARLILETQSRAEQEKILSDISSQMRETLDLETILQTAVYEMQKALQLSEIEVHLISETAETRE